MALMTIAAAQLRVGDVLVDTRGENRVISLSYGPAWITVISRDAFDRDVIQTVFSCCTNVRIERNTAPQLRANVDYCAQCDYGFDHCKCEEF